MWKKTQAQKGKKSPVVKSKEVTIARLCQTRGKKTLGTGFSLWLETSVLLFASGCSSQLISYQSSIVSSSAAAEEASKSDHLEDSEPIFAVSRANVFTSCQALAAIAEAQIIAQAHDTDENSTDKKLAEDDEVEKEIVSLTWYDANSGLWIEPVSCSTEAGFASSDPSLLSYFPLMHTVKARAFILETPRENISSTPLAVPVAESTGPAN